MKILVCAYLKEDATSGVFKKIAGQIKAFRSLGHDVYSFVIKDSALFLVHDHCETKLFKVSDTNIGCYLSLEKATRRILKQIPIDLIYIRRIFCSPFHLRTLSIAKRHGITLVEELPTYPYDQERHTKLSYRLAGSIDRFSRRFYKRYLDYFSTFSRDDLIFGVKTIQIENGIDLQSIPFEKTSVKREAAVNLIAVAAMCSWHGYDRLIRGLKAYFQEKEHCLPVYLHFVGDGPELNNWKQLSAELGLKEYVKFYGNLKGEELDKVYARCEVGIATMGGYKKGLYAGSELKIREYAAKGKLIVYSLEDAALTGKDFALKLANDDSAIDISRIVVFRNSFAADEEFSRRIRKFAEDAFSWKLQMQKVIACCEEKKGEICIDRLWPDRHKPHKSSC